MIRALTARSSWLVPAATAVTALALVGFMIASATSAAFTDTADVEGNVWETGSASLTLTEPTTEAAFDASNMVPGDQVQKSFTVENSGASDLDVKLYMQGLSDDDGLASYLDVTITRNGDPLFDDDLASLAGQHDSYDETSDSGIQLLAESNEDAAYSITVQLPDGASDAPQGVTAGVDFVWEGQTSPSNPAT